MRGTAGFACIEVEGKGRGGILILSKASCVRREVLYLHWAGKYGFSWEGMERRSLVIMGIFDRQMVQ